MMVARKNRWLVGVALSVISVVSHSQVDPSELTPEDIAFENRDLSVYGQGKVPSGIVHLQPDSSFYPPYVFIVDKAERVLSLWAAEPGGIQRLAVYPADIGKNQGDKRFLGDKATPEGIYFMLEKYEKSALDYNLYGSRAFTLNYPNFFDRIHKKTGSGIWLHAVPDTIPLTRGSRGCVVVRDKIIQTLHPYFRPGLTPVVIQEKVEFRSPEEQAELKESFDRLLTEWLNAWQSKDLSTFMSFYHPTFKGQGMNKEQWEQHKARLNSRYEEISISISQPVTFEHKDQFVLRFFQHYRSDRYEDFGEKTLYVMRADGKLKIIGEDWSPQPRHLAMDEIQKHSIASMNCGKDKKDCLKPEPIF